MTPSEVTHVIYHGRCPDGFTSAWAAWRLLGKGAEYIPAGYGQAPPELPATAKVAILDFSYPRAVLEGLRGRVADLVVLDHHKTAQADLAGLPYAVFDMRHSGAALAWEYFHPGKAAPLLVKYVEDRDLWRWDLAYSREISAWLGCWEMTFESWNLASARITNELTLNAGEWILKAKERAVRAMADNAVWAELGGHRVPFVNATVYFSEVGEELLKRHPEAPFAAYYLDRADGKRQWGLRGREGGVDVSAIAKVYGGGGHPAAAGFTGPVLLLVPVAARASEGT